MLNAIIEFSIKNKLIIGLLTLALILFGAYEVSRLPIDAVPDITNNQVQIIITAPSLGAPDVERFITFPLEQANSNIPGLKQIRSFSRFGLSLITIVFEDDVDIYWARQQVSERLKNASDLIPEGMGKPSLAPVTTGLGEIYQYVLRAKPGFETRFNAIELRSIQDWIVRRQLLGIKGVADVSSMGGKVKQYEIAIHPARLLANGITISDVFEALQRNNENTGGAYIEKASTVLFIRTEGLVKSMEDIQNIVIKNLKNGTPLLIRDVSEIRIGHAIRYGAMTYNDEGEVAGAVVMMLKGENSSQVIKDVKLKIEQIKKTLPEGVLLEPFLDRSKMVKSSIQTVSKNLLEGALIVVFILVLFLGNLRAGLLVASVIPLAMLFAVIMMNFFGVSGNLMSLGALDFGLMVDGAVIIIEGIMHQLGKKSALAGMAKITQDEMDREVLQTSVKMRKAAVFGEAIILIVYLPIFTLEGIEGKMFLPMAQTVAFALLGAFVLSLTYIPMMSALVLSKSAGHKPNYSDRMVAFFVGIQQSLLQRVILFPKTVIAFSIALFSVSMWVFSQLGGEFIPELPEGDFAVETRVLPGSNLGTSAESIMKASHILLNRFPEVEKIVGKIGSGEIPTDPMPMENTDMMVILKDKSEWTSAQTWNELADKMGEALDEVPGVSFGFQYPVAMRFNELMTGARQNVVCKIFGENLDTLSKYAKILGSVAAEVAGTKDIYVEPIDGLPQIIIRFNRNALAQYGLNVQEMNKIINTALAGQTSGQVFEDEKRFDLVVRLANEWKKDLQDVRNLLIGTPTGKQIPLYQLAQVSIEESVNQIQREDAKRRIVVGFNVEDRDVQTLLEELKQRVEQKIDFPSGYFMTYGGAFENLEAAKKRLALAVPISLVLIFILLFFAFGSVRQGLLIYSAIPLSAIGGILFLAFRGMPFSISAGVGFIALFGVAVLNGIVLLAEFNRIRAEGETDLRQVVFRGTRERLRPVLMTAFVASLGFLPMALSYGAGAEVQRPLATVVIGGLLIATLLTLFVLPVLYLLFERKTKISFPPEAKVLVLIPALFFFSGAKAFSQTPISLQAAIDTALKYNLQIKNEALNVEYQNRLKATAVDLPQASLNSQVGQFNSKYIDNGIGLQQSANFPVVYARQKAFYSELYKSSLLGKAMKEAEIKRQIREVFSEWAYFQEKKKILLFADSLLGSIQSRIDLRLEKGESNILEKASNEAQRGQISIQLIALQNDMDLLLIRLQWLMNSRKNYVPVFGFSILPIDTLGSANKVLEHPQLAFLKQQRQVSATQTNLLKARLYPDFFVGINSVTIQGVGADNRFYDRSQRFQNLQFGIGLPLFYSAQKAKIRAGKSLEMLAENQLESGLQTFQNELESALKTYSSQLKTVEYYSQNAKNQSKTISEVANQQLSAGAINYLEWQVLINQATSIRSAHADAIRALNQTIHKIEYLTSK
jgi:cobalt-zinc-cadmium resistance protein CzcA